MRHTESQENFDAAVAHASAIITATKLVDLLLRLSRDSEAAQVQSILEALMDDDRT